jgi:hypothetical protein|tara:strand:+ start:86 stop:361 length:276 start_codon:yes stop_codon:yes gene_type:complete
MKTIKITESQVKSQSDAILWHLKTYGSITSYEAIREYGATRLSAIIFNHRKEGYNIDSLPLTKKTRFGRNTIIAKYIYIAPPQELIQEILW